MNSRIFGTERLLICDASPLILLAKVSQLDLVSAFAREIWIPGTVWAELSAPPRRPELFEIERRFSDSVRKADDALQAAFSLVVDDGEAAVLALAAEEGQACLLMDDRKGRAVAAARGFRCIGTLGLLVRAKRDGRIEALAPLFRRLREEHWFIDPGLIEEALRAGGEAGTSG
jgi:predicted nucleic acid-binding protein